MIEPIKANTKFFFITWGIVLLVNQIFIFGGCLAPYCIVAALPHTGVISAVIVYLKLQEKKEKTPKNKHSHESSENLNSKRREPLEDKKEQYCDNNNNANSLKEMGDAYEKKIGQEFESKGNFVIYNGLIRGFDDRGVDLIVISSDSQSINLVQCKNWHKMKMEYHHISTVYDKLTDYESELNIAGEFDSDIIKHATLQKHLCYKKESDEIEHILQASKNYTNIRKTLYIATDQVVDLDIGQYLTMIKPNIFRYKDMKIAITKI